MKGRKMPLVAKLTCPGLAMWSNRLSIGPLPATQSTQSLSHFLPHSTKYGGDAHAFCVISCGPSATFPDWHAHATALRCTLKAPGTYFVILAALAVLCVLGSARGCLWAGVREPSREKLCPIPELGSASLELLPNSCRRLALMSGWQYCCVMDNTC